MQYPCSSRPDVTPGTQATGPTPEGVLAKPLSGSLMGRSKANKKGHSLTRRESALFIVNYEVFLACPGLRATFLPA